MVHVDADLEELGDRDVLLQACSPSPLAHRYANHVSPGRPCLVTCVGILNRARTSSHRAAASVCNTIFFMSFRCLLLSLSCPRLSWVRLKRRFASLNSSPRSDDACGAAEMAGRIPPEGRLAVPASLLSPAVTRCHPLSPAVTRCHPLSPAVTRCRLRLASSFSFVVVGRG